MASYIEIRKRYLWMNLLIGIFVSLFVIFWLQTELLATEIHDQVIQHDVDAVRDYLRQGGDPNRMSDYGAGDPLLFIAATEGTPEIVDLLIEAGARLDIFSAVVLEDLACVEGYVIQGNDVNIRDSWRRTLLHIAARYGSSREIIALLIIHGADLRLWDGQGKTPLQIAREQQRTDIIEYLQQAG